MLNKEASIDRLIQYAQNLGFRLDEDQCLHNYISLVGFGERIKVTFRQHATTGYYRFHHGVRENNNGDVDKIRTWKAVESLLRSIPSAGVGAEPACERDAVSSVADGYHRQEVPALDPDSAEAMAAPSEDHFICVCLNTPHASGFRPCDENGNEIEPDMDWNDLYVCLGCGRIADQKTYDPVTHAVQVVRGPQH